MAIPPALELGGRAPEAQRGALAATAGVGPARLALIPIKSRSYLATMTGLFVLVVVDDRAFRSRCRGALAAAGHRVAAPTTKEAAEYFLASASPPDAIVLSARDRWGEVLRDALRRTVRRVAVAVVDPPPDESPAGTRPVEETVRAALEELASEPVAWRDELRLGVDVIDAPHRAQVELLSALEEAVRAGRTQDGMARLRQLRIHAQAHFSGEESLMQIHGWQDREAHARAHVGLLDELGELAARWERDDPPPMARVVLSLRDWLEAHMLTLDRALARHLAPRLPAPTHDG